VLKIRRKARRSSPTAEAKGKRTRRWRPGSVALRQIRQFQQGTDLLIQRAAFQRLVREVASQHKEGIRFQSTALEALQEAAEAYVVSVLSDANLCALHCRRMTPQCTDLRLARRLRGDRT